MRPLLVSALALFACCHISSAQAKDVAWILNDQERQAVLNLFDEAVKAKGLSVASPAVYLMNKLNAAPIVTEQKSDPDKPPPAPDPQKDPSP